MLICTLTKLLTVYSEYVTRVEPNIEKNFMGATMGISTVSYKFLQNLAVIRLYFLPTCAAEIQVYRAAQGEGKMALFFVVLI